MSRLEDLTVGSLVSGLVNNEKVQVVAVKWYGSSVLEITYKNTQGMLASQLLYREDEAHLDVQEDNLPWSFDANGDTVRLASEAYRINLAHLFDPYLAVHTSSIEPLPHQISAVYQEMIPRLPLRYILADDPGAGKTIMTGLLLKELIIRGDLKRCLIVSPGSLSEQWQDELFNKFHLKFEILTNDRLESAVSGNAFAESNLCIARLDKLARNEILQDKLRATEWDLIVVDEAHKMSATVWGGEVKYTKRFQLGRLLSDITRHFLLLTATPHNGKEADFHLFMSLIDPERFEGAARSSSQAIDVSDVMRRLVKEDLLKFDGTPLFPERRAYTVNYSLSPIEATLYHAVTEYVQEEFNDHVAVIDQPSFKTHDLVHVPDVRQLVDLILHTHDGDLLIPGLVEDRPLSRLRNGLPVPPHHRLTLVHFSRRQGVENAEPARVKIQDQFLDHTAFSGGTPAFEQDDDRQLLGLDRTIQSGQLLLQRRDLFFVFFSRYLSA